MKLNEIRKDKKFKREHWDYWCVKDDLEDVRTEDYHYYIIITDEDREAVDWIEK